MSTELPFNQKGHTWDQVSPILSHDLPPSGEFYNIPLYALNSQGQEVVSSLMVQPVMEPTLHDYYDDIVREEDDDYEALRARHMSEESIQGLEEVRVEGLYLKEACPVCLEGLSMGLEAMRMPCLHVYHEGCIVEWLRKCNLCPLCRYEMPT
ncbi:E3 ubiquitin-protein ligase SGR9, amyloplastic-like [Quercus lobata]|uniref:E3 ubiquitin-protein ligase SGR9, amyloplastic-like n=1 Tax=Quercus lobata TaxID=97700 RepID=UPI001248DEC6|nr:E3 ubiquitin-protein ligase SGR9, amyloplastic-like [Quercus lobata]